MPPHSHFPNPPFRGRGFRPLNIEAPPSSLGGAPLSSQLPFFLRPLPRSEHASGAPDTCGWVRAKQGEDSEVYKPRIRGSCREAPYEALDETGVGFLVTPGLEGILKRRWEIVALESPPVFSHLSCTWAVTQSWSRRASLPRCEDLGLWKGCEEHVSRGAGSVSSTQAPERGRLFLDLFLHLDNAPALVYFSFKLFGGG